MEHSTLVFREKQGVVERRSRYCASRISACDPFSGTPGDMIARFPLRHSCRHCREEVISRIYANPRSIVFLRGVDQAIKAATDGCSFYEWLLDFLIRSRNDGVIDNDQSFYLHPKFFPGTRDDVYSITFMIGTLYYSWPCATFDVFAEAENPAASFITTRPFNCDVGSAASFQVAKGWLLDCHENHKKCFSSHTGYLPTRVIDLSGRNKSVVKIMPSYAYWSSKKAVYAILSYCWGGDQAYKTTRANLRMHQVSMQISRMSRTIQDAITVARSLGLDFLWVDSLCIIQDDPVDVVAEIAKMSEYFENSYVCISAAAAVGSSEGFLAPRPGNPYLYGPFELPYRGSGDFLGSVKIATYREYSSALDPINARAWIMQESLLAPRVLWYGYRNLVWSCQSFNQSDGGPYPVWHDFKDRVNWAKLQGSMAYMFLNQDFYYLRREFAPIEAWKATVRSYTARALTVANDKLPAISGIAQKYPRIILRYLHEWISRIARRESTRQYFGLSESDLLLMEEVPCPEYIAGIWKFEYPLVESFNKICSNITCQQLLWTTSFCKFYQSNKPGASWEPYTRAHDLPISHRITEYCAPSWSWASVDGPIIYEGWECEEHASNFGFCQFKANPKTPGAPFGSVESGYLIIEGRMREIVSDQKPSQINIIYRPDTEEDDSTLTRVLSGAQRGKIIELIEGGPGEKLKYPHWTPSTPKGLLLVADGEYYRRIGLFSLDVGSMEDRRDLLEKELSSFYNKPELIRIV